MNLTIEDIENVQRQIDELKAKLEKDKFEDLKKAYSEGAIIEAKQSYNEWNKADRPAWDMEFEYKIKGGISIDSWNVHKDLIKQFWNGAEIEFYNIDEWDKIAPPAWDVEFDYRIKPATWELPEYEDGNEFDINTVGRCRATKASKTRDLLEAWRDHLDPEYAEPDWNDMNENKYYIKIYGNIYHIDYNFNTKSLGTVYMREQTARKICKALNNGNISL